MANQSKNGKFLGVKRDDTLIHKWNFFDLISTQLKIQAIKIVNISNIHQHLMLAALHLPYQHALRLLTLHCHQSPLHIHELFFAVLVYLNCKKILDLELQLICLDGVYHLVAEVMAIVGDSFFAFLLLLVLAFAGL